MSFIFEIGDRRNSSIRNIGDSLGMKLLPEGDHDNMLTLAKDFKLFKFHRSGKISNMIFKEDMDTKHYFFDYKYKVSTGKATIKYEQSAMFYYSKNLSLPEFYLKPEQFIHKILAYLGFKDINFDHKIEFSDTYRLTGEQEEVIRYYFTDEILDFLEQRKNFTIECSNYYMLIYRHNELIHPKLISSFISVGDKLFELFSKRKYEL